MKHKIINKILLSLSLVFLLIGGRNVDANNYNSDYILEEVVILSRHNIRAPLSDKGSMLYKATPHTWFNWTSKASELSIKGSLLEEEMGRYFNKYLEEKELINDEVNYSDKQIRFYSNAKQRTIMTAKHFLKTFLPNNNINIITKVPYDEMDPTFTPKLTFISEEYVKDAKEEIINKMIDLEEEYNLLSDTLDFKESIGYKEKEIEDFTKENSEFILELDKEPSVKGSLRTATSLADALVLQYYEETDTNKASFNHNLDLNAFKKIGNIVETYINVLYTPKLISLNIANPLLKEIYSELNNDERIFSFLCGHDSNLASVLGALDVNEYYLDNAIETRTPIGSKIVFEKYTKDNEEYLKVKFFYASIEDIKDNTIDNLEIYDLTFKGLNLNSDGYYLFDDFNNHLKNSINEYNNLINKYNAYTTIIPDTSAK